MGDVRVQWCQAGVRRGGWGASRLQKPEAGCGGWAATRCGGSSVRLAGISAPSGGWVGCTTPPSLPRPDPCPGRAAVGTLIPLAAQVPGLEPFRGSLEEIYDSFNKYKRTVPVR